MMKQCNYLVKEDLLEKRMKYPWVSKKNWNELALENKLILCGDILIIPPLLQDRISKLAHEGHFGIVNTKRFLLSKVWFPNMDTLAENEIKHCLPSQATVYKHERELYRMSELTNGP